MKYIILPGCICKLLLKKKKNDFLKIRCNLTVIVKIIVKSIFVQDKQNIIDIKTSGSNYVSVHVSVV